MAPGAMSMPGVRILSARSWSSSTSTSSAQARDTWRKLRLYVKASPKALRRRSSRMAVMCTPMDATPFNSPSFPKSEETTKFLLDAINDNFVFDSIDDSSKLLFVNAMQTKEFSEGDWVIREGDAGDYFYVVEEGEIAFIKRGRSPEGVPIDPPLQVGTAAKGSTFGELALLYNTPREVSVLAVTPLKLFRIDQRTFRSLLMSQRCRVRTELLDLARKISIFQDLDVTTLGKLVDAFSIVTHRPGERIINKGDRGDVLYIVKSGKVRVETDIDIIVGEGECFGERALITGEARWASVTAVTQSSILCVSKGVLEELLGPLDRAMKHCYLVTLVRSIPMFKSLRRDEVDRCVRHFKEESFKKGDKIFPSEKFYLIKEGRALMMSNKEVCVEGTSGRKLSVEPKLIKLVKNDYFENLLDSYQEDTDALRSPADSMDKMNENTIYVEDDMVCFTLVASDFECVVGDLKTFFARSLDGSDDCVRSKNKRKLINLNKLKMHRILGKGNFGEVWLVTLSNGEDKPTPYALKIVGKRQVLKHRMVRSIMSEKNVMESCVHPFLMNMVSSFQDENNLYFVLDLTLGGELFDRIYPKDTSMNPDNKAWKASKFYKSFGPEDDRKALSRYGMAGLGVRQAVFYSACIIDGLAYLHNRRIAYRDLKPENVLINEKGYCVIIDMGFAKIVLDKTYTMCGTPEYIAPEVIASKGHDHVADYWSFACVLYEMIVGHTPFFTKGIDQLSLLKRIFKSQYTFPAALGSSNGNGLNEALCHWKDLVSRLLKNNSVERLGNLRNGVDDILDHVWFAHINFNEFRNQNNPAPWVPDIGDILDKSHGKDMFRKEVFTSKISDEDQAAFQDF
ncbi:hypothetical protein ACHAXA_006329 [Cyclostephanos tholiformis]|uniref:cGMP-dependent protein kinase n=1 Tax=Cyclostephanos tholiformis TaxID=382380 RepID=A0ABD3R2J2_9STRA